MARITEGRNFKDDLSGDLGNLNKPKKNRKNSKKRRDNQLTQPKENRREEPPVSDSSNQGDQEVVNPFNRYPHRAGEEIPNRPSTTRNTEQNRPTIRDRQPEQESYPAGQGRSGSETQSQPSREPNLLEQASKESGAPTKEEIGEKVRRSSGAENKTKNPRPNIKDEEQGFKGEKSSGGMSGKAHTRAGKPEDRVKEDVDRKADPTKTKASEIKSDLAAKAMGGIGQEQVQRMKNLKRAAAATKAAGSFVMNFFISLLHAWMPILVIIGILMLILASLSLNQNIGPNPNACSKGMNCGIVCPSSMGLGEYDYTFPESLAGNDNKEKVWFFLTSRGFSDIQAAGAMGNLSVETGGTFSPNALNLYGKTVPGGGTHDNWVTGETAYGLLQWRAGRLDSLKKYVTEISGKDISYVDTLEGQLGYIMYEITETSESGAYKKFFEATATSSSPEQAAEAWDTNVERSSGSSVQTRMDRAKEIYSEMTGSSAGGTNCTMNPGSVQEMQYFALSGYIARSYSMASRSNNYISCDGEIPSMGTDCLMKNSDGADFFDCSSYVGWVFYQLTRGEMQLPGTTASMRSNLGSMDHWSTVISGASTILDKLDQLLPGDVIVYEGHTGIVLSTPSMPLMQIPDQFVPAAYKGSGRVGNSWNDSYNPSTYTYIIENGGGGNTLLDGSSPVTSSDGFTGTGDIKPVYDQGSSTYVFRYDGFMN